ncbi:hypothetical protein AVEN_182896-1 [Araneus ventricosus]|uniref:Uncharacterized protein n=1 Tax=Araneus ventricosus TaxID=182803 RepID=A0A4Y2SFT7_ARAVE|nr:hypothetical protein AVEN_182896-1 [Araneus ventricosus]
MISKSENLNPIMFPFKSDDRCASHDKDGVTCNESATWVRFWVDYRIDNLKEIYSNFGETIYSFSVGETLISPFGDAAVVDVSLLVDRRSICYNA